VLVCDECKAWYPIETDVLELVPPQLFECGAFRDFQDRFSLELKTLGLETPAHLGQVQAEHFPQIKQREHFDLYAENAPGFSDYTLIPFIRATSRRYLQQWRSKLTRPDAWLLDIGCGTGLHSYPLMDKVLLLGFDISRKAVRKATEDARVRGLMHRSTFFVSDGAALPIREQSFDYVQTLGVLHHLPNPRDVVIDIQRLLKSGGVHFAVENNESVFRWIFDVLMKWWPLWIEEAGAHPLVTRNLIEQWITGLPVQIESETSIFLPPHLLNLLGKYAPPVVEKTDHILSRIPWLRNHGGQLVFSLSKTS
jgi:SAM-dependent methyltransferase